MSRRILLVRHGRSAHVADGRWLNADGVRDFLRAYDAAEIALDDAPPPTLVDAATTADVIMSSDLPRALASARRLAPGRTIAPTPLLREIQLGAPTWVRVPVPIIVWDVLHYLRWSYQLFRKVSSADIQRAEAAIDWLTAQVDEDSTAVVITHGSFRRLLAARLEEKGWRPGAERRSYDNWSSWSFRS
jgi:broad specificity phosphatase PhoE